MYLGVSPVTPLSARRTRVPRIIDILNPRAANIPIGTVETRVGDSWL